MSAPVVWREPSSKLLPMEAQKKMKDVALPEKLERARQAVAACTDLSELMGWHDQTAAIAAAAKAAKMPDIAKGALRIQKEAMAALGAILSRYSSATVRGKGRQLEKSERRIVADAAGIPVNLRTAATSLAALPDKQKKAIIENEKITAEPTRVQAIVVATRSGKTFNLFRWVMRGVDEYGERLNHQGLNGLARTARLIREEMSRQFTLSEKSQIRQKVAEIEFSLKEIDEALQKVREAREDLDRIDQVCS